MLEEHCCSNLDSACLESLALDTTLRHLRDHVALCHARKDLTLMAGDKKKDDGLHCRIWDMISLLNLFLNDEMEYLWREVSVVVAKPQSHCVAHAWSIQHWVLHFLQTDELLHLNYSSTCSPVLVDEKLCHEIQATLGKKSKHGSIKVTNLVNVIASPKIQEQFKNTGINKSFIFKRTAHCWLRTLGWWYGKIKNGMYIDGHERKDVVQYRTAFVDCFQQYEWRFHLWDNNGEALLCPNGFPVPEAASWFRLILVTHSVWKSG